MAASTILAITAVTVPLSQHVFAAEAIWSGTTLTYEGREYNQTTAPPNRQGEPNEYEWRLNTGGPTIANVLYFGNNPGNQQQATLVEYDVLNGNYTQSSPPQTVTVTRDLTVDDQGSAESVAGTTCNVTGIGWIICPIASWMSEGVDWVYGIVEGFLEVQTITRSDSGVYQIWELIRNIANVAFLIVFLAIVYSQLTGVGYSNHNIKDMIPRLVIGAALVNVSFWICALAVDASNLLGYSIQSIFVTVRENIIMTPAVSGEDFTWAGVTAAILGGGAAGFAGLAAATAGSGISLSFLLIAALLPAAFAVLVAFIILAARQALIVVLTMISPLAFVAMVLPSTQNLFDKWRKAFTTLLVFFPIFAFIFGGSQLAGTAILNSAADAQPAMQIPLILIGLATIVVPLIITPLLVRFSSGLLGQIANFANSKNRGLIDRAQNWARDNAELHKTSKMAKTGYDVERRRRGELGRFDPRGRGAGRLGLRFDQQKRRREAIKGLNEEYLAARSDKDWQQSMLEPSGPGRVRRTMGMQSPEQMRHNIHDQADVMQRQAKSLKDTHHAHADRSWNEYLADTSGTRGDGQGKRYRQLRTRTAVDTKASEIYDKQMSAKDDLTANQEVKRDGRLYARAINAGVTAKEAGAYQEEIDAKVSKRWAYRQQNNPDYRAMRTDTFMTGQEAEVIDKSMTAADQLKFDKKLKTNTNPAYTQLRQAKIQTTIDSKESGAYQDALDATAEERWILRQEGDRGLRSMRTDTTLRKGRTEAIDKSMSAADQRKFDELVDTSTDPGYLRVRDAKVQTIIDSGHSDLRTKLLDSEGKMQFKDEVMTTPSLQRVVSDTVANEKAADIAENIVKKRAEAEWDDFSRTDQATQRIRLQEVAASDRAKLAETQWQELVQQAMAKGSKAPDVRAGNQAVADTIQTLQTDIAAEERAIEAAKLVQNEQLAAAFKDSMENDPNRELLKRAGGIGGERAQTRIYAKAKGEVVSAAVEEVKKINRVLTSEMTRSQLQNLMKTATMPDGSKATVEMQQAAMYALLQEKGNNEDAQEIRDAVAMMGMMVHPDTGEYYEALRDSRGRLIRNADGFPIRDDTKKITDKGEIERRRDWQQFFDDAKKDSPHSMVTYSGTNQSEARAGTMVDDMRGGFIRDAIGGKFSPQKMLKADIDELKFLYEDLHSPDGYFADLNDEQKQKVRDTLEGAIINLQSNENINAGIDDRNRGVMNDILAMVNPDRYRPVDVTGEGKQEKRSYRVDKNKAIIPLDEESVPGEKRWAAPINVPGVQYTRDDGSGYYRRWDVDLQLEEDAPES